MRVNLKFSKAIILSILLGNIFSLYAQENYYTAQNIYRFAEYLYAEGDYLRAAGEYQRYMFFSDILAKDSILFKIGLCYELSNEPGIARTHFQNLISTCAGSALSDSTYYHIALTYFQSREYEQSIDYITRHMSFISSLPGRQHMGFLTGINYLYKKKWQSAYDYFSVMPADSVCYLDTSLLSLLREYSKQGIQLSRKSRTAAGLFSAIIPGTGKIYSRHLYDGLYSFCLIGLVTWQAYAGFHKDGTQSVKGWFYGTVGTIFYLGNIYGSIVSVKLYNDTLENDLINRIDLNLIWRY